MLLHRCLHPRETSQGSTEGSCLLIVRTEQLAAELICSHSCGGQGWKAVVVSAPAGLPPPPHVPPLSSAPHGPPGCRNVGLSRPGPGFAESSLHHDEDGGREGGPEAKMEVAADAAEQGGRYLSAWQSRDHTVRGQSQGGVRIWAPRPSLSCEISSNGSVPNSDPLKRSPLQQSGPAHSHQTSISPTRPGVIMKTNRLHSQGCPNLNGELDGHPLGHCRCSHRLALARPTAPAPVCVLSPKGILIPEPR